MPKPQNDQYLSVSRRSGIDRANVMPTDFDDRSIRKPSSTSSFVSIGMLQIHEESGESLPGRMPSTSSSTNSCKDSTDTSGRLTPITDSRTALMTAIAREDDIEELESDTDQVSVFEEHPKEESTIDTILIDEDSSVVDNCRNANRCTTPKDRRKNLKNASETQNSSDNVKDTSDIIHSGSSKSSKTIDANGMTSPITTPGSDSQITMGWRPVMPGYKDVHHSTGRAVVIQRTLEVNSYDGSLRDSIPAMPKVLAVICFVFNIVTPGIGTLLAGLSVLCCSRIRGGGDKVSVIWINTCVTLLQIITTPLFLLGWIWSILWGMSFLTFSDSSKCQCFGYECMRKNTEQISVSETTENGETLSTPHQRSVANLDTSNGTLCVQDNDLLDIGDEQSNGNSQLETAPQSIIVLQEAPVVSNHPVRNYERRGSMQVRRNSRQYGRQNRAESLPHVLLDPQTLENIITRNGAIPAIFRSESEQNYEEHLKSPFSVT